MRFRLPMAIAATVAAIAIAVPVTLHLTKGTTFSMFGEQPASSPRAAEQRRVELRQAAQERPPNAPVSVAVVPSSPATYRLHDRGIAPYAERAAPRTVPANLASAGG